MCFGGGGGAPDEDPEAVADRKRQLEQEQAELKSNKAKQTRDTARKKSTATGSRSLLNHSSGAGFGTNFYEDGE